MSSDSEFWVNCVRYRTRADAYRRIDNLDIDRIRSYMGNFYSDAEINGKSDDVIRQEIKDLADLIYSDTMATSSPNVCIIHAGKEMFIFAGGFTTGAEPPSDEFEIIAYLKDLNIDEDFE